MKRFRKLLVLLFLMITLGASLCVWISHQFASPLLIAKPVELVIPKGVGLNKVAHLLYEKNVITNARLFILYGRLYRISSLLKAGEYNFFGEMTLIDVARKLTEGDVIVRTITIPEGKSLAEIKQILNANPYLVGDISIGLKEGDVLPETYHFSRGESRNSILKKAKQAMQIELQKIFKDRDPNIPIHSEKELLVLASIVEKETGLPSERGKVASVFVNRLNIGMKLQTDPTVIYAVTNGQMNLKRPLYRKDLAFDSPYNTYLYAGLPPTPICSPGKDALYAAAHPEKTKYLYFVADGVSGGHRFARTLTEHNKNVVLYRRAMKK